MSEENKALVRKFVETAISGGNPEAAADLVSADFRQYFGAMPAADFDAFKQFLPAFMSAFSDFSLTFDDLVAEGDTVAGRWHWTAVHKGDFMGVPASGKNVEVIGMGFYVCRGGKIVEDRALEDIAALMQQIAPSA